MMAPFDDAIEGRMEQEESNPNYFACDPCECGGHPDCPVCRERDVKASAEFVKCGYTEHNLTCRLRADHKGQHFSLSSVWFGPLKPPEPMNTDYLWKPENEPKLEETGTVYCVKFPNPVDKRNQYYAIWVEVDRYDLANVQEHSIFLGKSFKNMDWKQRREVYDFLIEWELCEWRRIGPEDSELFATDKLRAALVDETTPMI